MIMTAAYDGNYDNNISLNVSCNQSQMERMKIAVKNNKMK